MAAITTNGILTIHWCRNIYIQLMMSIVYYDPTGLIDKNDVAAQGIQVLIGINELREWYKDLES
jgi:hypothetical protein